MANRDALCGTCVAALKERVSPTHPIDPDTLELPTPGMRGILACPTCRATWQRFDDMTVLVNAHPMQS